MRTMDSLSLTRALRRLQRTVVMLRTELRHEHVDEGLIADIEAQLEAGIATHPRTQHLRHLVDDLRESTLTPRPELLRDAIRCCDRLSDAITELTA